MKKYVNGEYIEMTAEEIEEMKTEAPAGQSPTSLEDRVKVVEQGFEKLKKMFSAFGGGFGGS